MYHLKFTIHGNPDYDQGDWEEQIALSATTFPELVEKVREFQGKNQIGGGNWGTATLSKDGTLVGFMSYNGRVWKTPYSGIGATEVFP